MGYCAEKVYMDKQGVIRWTENRKEVALFGANSVSYTHLTLPTIYSV